MVSTMGFSTTFVVAEATLVVEGFVTLDVLVFVLLTYLTVVGLGGIEVDVSWILGTI